ncbi:MAG: ferredoxin family protein [Syntrophotalea acetylenica]|jgi:2-oxoglutarate ferredoxin oxidoreductase subunit delta|uniref:4Fe-4S dicluster domain-containing protein n=1 Tax=Syntrophotalea acetylenica TaxID=29542 RepID=UPI000931FD08|nr:ferredoxin family protein [Syntrophotalea acetylenica]MDD4456477.1 ferredoxin family protein [Syntrophotalea acetylenica]MDY0262665.1 ferredoxin family protein [Syntrophotalea acetylenica]
MFAYIEIDIQKCKGCGLCTIACPRDLIKLDENLDDDIFSVAVFLEGGHCYGCAFCASVCPDLAIKVCSLCKNEITGRMNKKFSCYRKIVENLSR